MCETETKSVTSARTSKSALSEMSIESNHSNQSIKSQFSVLSKALEDKFDTSQKAMQQNMFDFFERQQEKSGKNRKEEEKIRKEELAVAETIRKAEENKKEARFEAMMALLMQNMGGKNVPAMVQVQNTSHQTSSLTTGNDDDEVMSGAKQIEHNSTLTTIESSDNEAMIH